MDPSKLVTDEPTDVKKLKKKLRGAEPPVGNDPMDTLKILVRQHRNTTRFSVSCGHMGRTEVIDKATGEKVKREVPAATAALLQAASKDLSSQAQGLKDQIKRALRGIPIYENFFKRVTFTTPMLAAYLIAEVDIRKTEKSSGLRRFCGFAVIDGKLERPRAGEKRHYNANLRTQTYLAFTSLLKNQKHHDKNGAGSSKYLKIWRDSKHRDLQKEGVFVEGVKADGSPAHKKEIAPGKMVSWDKHAHSYGWHKAADRLIEDLYIVWRAQEGLPIWPDYYAAKLGYEHGGKISVNAPKMLSLDEAIGMVFEGYLGEAVEQPEEADEADGAVSIPEE